MKSTIALARLETALPERIAARVRLLLAGAPDFDKAVLYLGRLRDESPAAFLRIASSPAALRCAIGLFANSKFLSEAVMRNPERINEVSASGSFYRVLTAEDYSERLFEFLGGGIRGVPLAVDLARFRRRQLLRIVLRDVLGAGTLSDVTEELSNLADSILDAAYWRIREDLAGRHGEPQLEDGRPCGFSVISLGKLGGKELNYSSDIDLMFVYGGAGQTNGREPISNKEFYKKVANEYTALLSSYTAEGQCYRVDLRLRPDGRLGEICISLDGARTYYAQRARDWEKQMLIKARISAGEPEPAQALLDFVEPLIYESSLDFRAVEAVSETRQRIGERARARRARHGGLDIKLTSGGIRDIEFLVQCLQRLHGGREPWVRHGGTQLALFRLRDKGLLSGPEYAQLANAYQLFRKIEHRLQMEDDLQTHTLPTDPDALDLLARKTMDLGGDHPPAADALLRELEENLSAVREIYERVIYAQKPLYYTGAPDPAPVEEEKETAPASITRFLDERAPHVAEAVAASGLNRGRERFEHFLERTFASHGLLERLNGDPPLAAAVLDVFEHSGHFADELLRQPDLVEEIGRPVQLDGEPLTDAGTLRRFYRRRMLRVQSRSMSGGVSIFDTLAETSALADCVIQAAYRVAMAEAPPPSSASYEPRDQMMVIALGRLGMREFDLGSDADLVFVIPDADAPETSFWTGVAERMIHIMGAYTGEGVIFTVDTRLRPNGREGDLVQSEGAYKSYFATHAEAWEGITYMKSRAIAGNQERATQFLNDLQVVDWRRYGQSMRSRKDLAAMRARLEKEQGARNPLKAGMGGYYDIDFALMYLRLKGAGIFFKVLNTPERIDVIEKMGHLEREDADFLRDAATFYRAVDHGQRISTGHAEGKLPTSQSQLEILTALVNRWAPETLRRQRLDATLRDVRTQTREFFNRLFGK